MAVEWAIPSVGAVLDVDGSGGGIEVEYSGNIKAQEEDHEHW